MILALLGAFWNFSNFMTDIYVSIFWLQTTYAFGALMIATGLVWTLLISGKLTKIKTFSIYSIAIIFSCASYIENFVVKTYDLTSVDNIFISQSGWGLDIYAIFYSVNSCLILYTLYSAIKKTGETEQKHQLTNVFAGALIMLTITFCTSFILPNFLSIFVFSTLDSLGFLIFLLFIAYSITKHRLFNIRVIAIEVVMFMLWLTLIFQAFRAETHEDLVISIAVLAVTVIFGVLLIRSTLNEIYQQAQIEKLSDELRKAYARSEHAATSGHMAADNHEHAGPAN